VRRAAIGEIDTTSAKLWHQTTREATTSWELRDYFLEVARLPHAPPGHGTVRIGRSAAREAPEKEDCLVRRFLRHPVRLVPLGFLAAILLGTGLLMLPWATSEHRITPFVTALFTATSAVSVTGMAVVDTPNYWNTFGLVMITVLTQIGGIGIVTGATLVILLVARQLGLRNRLLVQAETQEFGIGDVRRLLLRIAATALVCEAVITAILAVRLAVSYDYPPGRADSRTRPPAGRRGSR